MKHETNFLCPECSSPNVTETAEQKWMVNTGEHYCHSVKTHDADAKSDCLDCGWTGLHMNLMPVTANATSAPK